MTVDRPLFVLVLASTLALAGCAGPSAPGAENELEDAAMVLEPGTDAATLLTFSDPGIEPTDATVSVQDAAGLDVEGPQSLQANETGALTGWMEVSVPENATEKDHEVVVSLSGPAGEATEVAVPVTVTSPSDPLKQGEIAMLELTARTASGDLAFTNAKRVASAGVPHAEGYQAPQGFQPIPAPLSARSQLPGELIQAVVGTGVNHSLSVDVAEAFGPSEFENERDRQETVEREVSIPVTIDLPPQQAQRYLPRGVQQGDEVDLPVVQNASSPVPYTVESMSQRQIHLELALEEGERFTLHQAWTDGANVTAIGSEQATLSVTPTQGEGEMLTWVEPWGNTTEILEITNDTITLEHNPEPGLTYTTQTGQARQPVETTVVEVTDDAIVLSQENPHPLAGETLTFQVTVLDRQQAPQRGPGGQPSPR